MFYTNADRAIKAMNRENLKRFGRLKLMRHDELNIVREVKAVYDQAVRDAENWYLDIARLAYADALRKCGTESSEARKRAKRRIGMDWVLLYLMENDPLTLYQFIAEADRKKQRLIEALSATQSPSQEVDKALRYWAGQTGQYAISITDAATIQAFKDAGIKKVIWHTEHDDRVCKDCEPLDGQVFDIDKIPVKPHLGCRCWIEPVIE